MLLGGVVGLLLFNTSMQQVSFAATALEDQATTLTAQQQALQMELDRLRDPQRVAGAATRLGMVPAGTRRSSSSAPAGRRQARRRRHDPAADQPAAAGKPSRALTPPPNVVAGPGHAAGANIWRHGPPEPRKRPRRAARIASRRTRAPDPSPGPRQDEPPVPPSRPPPSAPAAARRCCRLRVGFLVIAMVVSVFAARLVQLQGVDPHSYAAMAAAEGLVEVVLPAERGDILDRNGVPLAESIDGLMIVADPR